MSPIDEPGSFEPKRAAAEPRKAKTGSATTDQPPSPDLVAITLDAASGQIVKVERIDGAGARREISDEERGRLAENEAKAALERVVEQAFEAGIDCVLGDGAVENAAPESEEDAELSRLLLRSLIQRSAAKTMIERDVLSRTIVGALLEQAAATGGPPPESAAAH